jgi:uncharacterized protein
MTEENFPITEVNRVRQVARRGQYDRDTVYSILDDCLVGQLAFIEDGKPVSVPMLFGRDKDRLLFHGSNKSRVMQLLVRCEPVCFTAMLIDGLVLAKSLFHHSMNYRSVSIFGCGRECTTETEKIESMRIITDKIMPHRWTDARFPNPQEMKATCVVSIEIELASAKIRSGDPIEDAEDIPLPHWAGVLPLRMFADTPVAAAYQSKDLDAPDYIQQRRAQFNQTRKTNG